MRTVKRLLGAASLASAAMLALACSHDTSPPAQHPVTTTSAAVQNGTGTPSLEDLSDPASRHTMAETPTGTNPLDTRDPAGPTSLNDEPSAIPGAAPAAVSDITSGDVLTKSEPKLSDGQVVAIVIGANQGEIQLADLGIRDATTSDVKQFAAMMKNHHTTGLQKAKTTQAKAKLTSAPSDVSGYLDNEVTTAIKDLKGKSGAAFDRAYMDTQVQAHKDVLTALDNRLIPSASNGEVKSLLTETRQIVASHLAKAQDIDGRMSPATSTPSSRRETSGSSLAAHTH